MSGRCYYCYKELDKRGIKRHLNACKVRKERINTLSLQNDELKNYYIIEVWDKYNKSDYWMYIACHIDSKLSDIDKFLRDVWLECCGHLSDFVINDVYYDCSIDEDIDIFDFGKEQESMNIMLKEVLNVDSKFKYRYDFGDTTELEGKVLEEFMYSTENNRIEIMARHNNPRYECVKCKNKAIFLSCESGILCGECADEDEWVSDLGDLSSPRSGVCGYSGTREDEIVYRPVEILKYQES